MSSSDIHDSEIHFRKQHAKLIPLASKCLLLFVNIIIIVLIEDDPFLFLPQFCDDFGQNLITVGKVEA